MNKISKIFHINIVKTIYFNFLLFGLRGLINPKLLIGYKCQIQLHDKKDIIFSDNAKVFLGVFSGENRHSLYNKTNLTINGRFKAFGRVNLSKGCDIFVHRNAVLTISDTYFGPDCSIICNKKITFNGETIVSWNCMFLDGDTHPIYDDCNLVMNPNREILIGTKCWIGCNTSILKGCQISNNIIVSANSVVTKNLSQEKMIYVGNKAIKEFNHFSIDESDLFREE